jgi:predicted metal-binding membrane protein
VSDSSALEYVLKRDRMVVLAGLVGVTAVAWIYLVVIALGMAEMPATVGEAMAMAHAKPWSALDFLLMFLMWAVMMVGMMVPSAAPMILLFATISRKSREQGGAFVPVGVFASAYVVVWGGFSLLATLLQWLLDQSLLLTPMMASASPILGGGLLIGAGIYQLTPLKSACLQHCRSPIHFISHGWRPGVRGALRMGLEHGLFCLGCCWVLMGLLFFGGVMNLLWIAAIAVFVFIEKVAPLGAHAGRLSGLALIAAGVFVLAQG